jgi:F-type H+-transporting ATPase subunit delta
LIDGSGVDPVVDAYAHAIVTAASAENSLERVEDELFRFARAVQGNTELRERLGDDGTGIATRLEIIDELLPGAHAQTTAAAGYVVQAGRLRQLVDIADAVVAIAAAQRSQAVAVVRSAVALDADQRQRLTTALEEATGKQVSVKVVVDPQVVGGLVVTMGDNVIDGSVARRLAELRVALTGA